jgi:tetratricopeptide (TPR) repeat protein
MKRHPERSFYLINLGNSLRTRFERVGDTEDLRRAIDFIKEGLELIPSPYNPADRATALNSLGNAMRKRFDRSRMEEDLNEAIAAFEEAIELLPSDSFYRPDQLNSIVSALCLRSEVT